MQLSFDAADRLVELIAARRGPVSISDAARCLFALSSAPTGIASALLREVVDGDDRLRLAGSTVALVAAERPLPPLHEAEFVVFDLETTGLSPGTARICEIGAQRVHNLELRDWFETLVDPGVPLPQPIVRLTGITSAAVRGAPRPELAVRRLLAFAGEATLVAHNARFDLGFLDREVERLTGRRVAAPVVDTVWLARRLLGDRLRRVGLASLAHFFGVPTEPCHRALPDARATAEILLRLIGLAQERGAESVADLVELSAPRARRLHAKRFLVAEAPPRPGVYLFRDSGDLVLYVGRARNLRLRLRSYFSGGRQRPVVEAAVAALARVEWRVLGSELEAALEELRLLRELRPPSNARSKRPDRYVYLTRCAGGWAVTDDTTEFGPLKSRRLATLAARALSGYDGDDPAAGATRLRARMRSAAAAQRFEDAARLRDRLEALERTVTSLEELRRLRCLELCVVAPAREPGFVRAFFVAMGRVTARTLPCTGGAVAEAAAGVAEARRGQMSVDPHDADALLVIAQFLRTPPPELRVCALAPEAIARVVRGLPLAA